MSLFTNDLDDLNEDSLNLDNTEERWTEPLNPGTNSTLIYKPAVSKTGHNRTIIHFDIDCFYAQVEMLRNPGLQNKPLGIQQKNIVVTTNYIARKCGVPKSTFVSDAKKICPNLVLVCGEDLTNYRQMSYTISEFFQKYTPCVERLGFDENFIDASELVQMRLQNGTYKQEFVGHVYHGNQGPDRSHCRCGCELRLQIGSQIAAEIREALHKEIGITSCAGIGHNKLLAKVIAGTHKPNQQTTVLPHLALDLLSSFSSVLCIPGIGYRTSHRLNALGISSVADLQAADRRVLVREFGPQMAQLMDQLSHGVDDSPVVAYSQPQTLSDEDAFKCCKDIADVEQRIKELTSNLLKRVAEDGRIPQTVRLTVRRVPNKYHRETRQCPVPRNIFTKFLHLGVSEEVVERLTPVLMNLFRRLVDPFKPFHLTLIAVCFAKLKPADELRGIGTFFTKAETRSPCAESKLVTDKATDSQAESKHNSNSKFSSAELELKAKVKTMKHFFSSPNTELHSVSLHKSNTAGWKASQLSQSHRSNSSLPVTDASIVTDVSLTTEASLAVTDVPLTMVPAAQTDISLTRMPSATLVPQTTIPSVILVPLTTMSSATFVPLTNTLSTLVPLTTMSSATFVPLTNTLSTLVPLTTMSSATFVPLTNTLSTLVPLTTMPPATTDAPLTAMPQATYDELLPETDHLLTESDACERSLIQGSIKRQTTTSNMNLSQLAPKGSIPDFPRTQLLKDVMTIPHTEALPPDLPGYSLDIKVHSLEEDCLQKLLSAGIDVETITELPLDIQNEVLLQYGIYVEDLPEGRRFNYISDKVRTRSGNTPKLATVKTRCVHSKQRSSKRNLEKTLLDAEVVDRLSKQRKIFCRDDGTASNESLWKVSLTETGKDSRGMEALCGRYGVEETLLSDVIEDQQHHLEMTLGHSLTVTDEQPRRRNTLNTLSLCSNISQLTDKESDCVNIFHLPRKDSDKELDCNSISDVPGNDFDVMNVSQLLLKDCMNISGQVSDSMDISELSGKTSDCNSISHLPGNEPDGVSISHVPEYDFSALPPQRTNKEVPNRNIDICAMELGLPQSNSQLTSDCRGECQEPVRHTSPADILPQPCGSISSLSNVRKAHCRRLPDSIDSEVFSSLPSNIRGEIMAHVVMGTLDSACGQHRKFLAPDHKRNLKQARDTKAKNQNSLLTYFKRDNTDAK
ncbi:unnamed protein product [Candidula unifasciata]|uniref:UmuC domain-containing protein n=1 Tax=Candidula unifasciata TaxID=100452 RepID=A0A8S3YKJ7_9EUPU|nr:unnamed protein product [Candidula unifasciata]